MIKPIINHKKKFIYFMIPKNASSTIRHLLKKEELQNSDLKYKISDLKNFEKIDQKDVYKYKNYFWFTFIRYPHNRLFSVYNDKVLAMTGDQIYKPLYNPMMSYESFIEMVCSSDDLSIDWHLKSQSYYISEFLKDMDFVGTVEIFNQDIETLKKRLRIKYSVSHLRQTKGTYFYSKELKKKIYNRYQEDFKIFYENYTTK